VLCAPAAHLYVRAQLLLTLYLKGQLQMGGLRHG
jgi:hypothetical protein